MLQYECCSKEYLICMEWNRNFRFYKSCHNFKVELCKHRYRYFQFSFRFWQRGLFLTSSKKDNSKIFKTLDARRHFPKVVKIADFSDARFLENRKNYPHRNTCCSQTVNATDINEVSIKTRYPDLSFDTGGIILEGLVQKIDIYDNSCSFGNCSFQSIYEVDRMNFY